MTRAPSATMVTNFFLFCFFFNIWFLDVSVSDMNDEDGAGNSSKSNSITSEHSLQSTGISASSQGSSTNSLPKNNQANQANQIQQQMQQLSMGAAMGMGPGSSEAPHDNYGHHHHHPPTSFHRSTLSQPQGGPSPSLSAKSKLSQVMKCVLY